MNDALRVLLRNGANALEPNKKGDNICSIVAHKIPMRDSTSSHGVTPPYSKKERSMHLCADVLGITCKKSVHYQYEDQYEDQIFETSRSLFSTLNTVFKDGPKNRNRFISNINAQLDREFELKLTIPPSTCKKRVCTVDTSLVSTKKRKTGVCNGSNSGKNQGG
ncbi:hypothetical protein ACRRVB_02240 [Candidatus Cardinium hertigii]|uniref:hypothetical protein n=1 Tax=Candidatus Cardinium hertigii TaxID=247481 RepID=UPI003D7D95A9